MHIEFSSTMLIRAHWNAMRRRSPSMGRCGARIAGWLSACACVLGVGVSSAAASVFYDFNVVAHTGLADSTGNSITTVSSGAVAINDNGAVAFVSQTSNGQAVYLRQFTDAKPVVVSFAPSPSRSYANGIKVDNSNRVVARDQVTGPANFIRIWDGNAPGTFNVIASGRFATDVLDPNFTAFDFDSVLSDPSMNNAGRVVFSALTEHSLFKFFGDCPDSCLATKNPAGSLFEFNVTSLPIPLRPKIADDGSIIARAGSTPASPIRLYSFDFASFTDLSSGFTEVGRSPGVSADGKIVAFTGNRGSGRGVFIRINESGTWGPPIAVAGETVSAGVCTAPELGYNDSGQPLCFASLSDAELDSRVGVMRESLGDAGNRDDSIIIAFLATPNAASRDNAALPGKPLLFSANAGLWTVRVDLERPIDGTAGWNAHKASPLPVAQVGDAVQTPLGARQIGALAVTESIGAAATDEIGAIRTQRRGDHRLAFFASTTAGESLVVRASHLDSDQDGLLDHWERAGGGIDIDQDGVIDLNLNLMGASPSVRDLFLEIDWLTDRTTGVPKAYSHRPPASMTDFIDTVFRHAPALSGALYGVRSDGAAPADIPAAIVAHVDAGNGVDAVGVPLSKNMGGPAALRQGGDAISASGASIDVVYMGIPGSKVMAGVVTRSMDDIKRHFFGTTDKSARELAFHYAVLADFYDFFPTGGPAITGTVSSSTPTLLTATAAVLPANIGWNAVIITSGRARGEIRTITANNATTLQVLDPWPAGGEPQLNDTFALLTGSTGVGEADWRADFGPFPGNDHIVTIGTPPAVSGAASIASTYRGTPFMHRQTVVHELGHTLGLRHGGVDHRTAPFLCGGTAAPCAPVSPNFKRDYFSLMNYAYQLNDPQPDNGLTIEDYAQPGDPTFVDWDNLRLDFQNNLSFVGNSFSLSAAGASAPPAAKDELTLRERVEVLGMPDSELPTVAITSPADNGSLALGAPLTVVVDAHDNVRVDDVIVAFDLNGDGAVQGATEIIAATNLGAGHYQAVFGNATGPAGRREVSAIAVDSSLHQAKASISLNVGAVSSVTVPNVVGLTQAAATTAITGVGLIVGTITTQPSATVPAGNVISQNPAAGASVAAGSAVALVVSSGPPPVTVPNVVGLTQAAATTAITGAGLVVGTVTTQPSATVPAGKVISQNPAAGASVAAGSAVALVVSSGPAPVTVPNVVGLTQAAATTAITGAGLVVGTVTTQPSATVPAGNVISQNPAAGASVAAGSAVALVVSSGPTGPTVPNVVGQTQAAAQATITVAGYSIGTLVVRASTTIAPGTVIAQSPAAGTAAAVGTKVDLVISMGTDITATFSATRSGLLLNRSTNTFDQTVTMTLKSGVFHGPLFLVIDTLTPGTVTLANAHGANDSGKPMVSVAIPAAGLKAGEHVMQVLKFANPGRVAFSWTSSLHGTPPSP